MDANRELIAHWKSLRTADDLPKLSTMTRYSIEQLRNILNHGRFVEYSLYLAVCKFYQDKEKEINKTLPNAKKAKKKRKTKKVQVPHNE